MHWIVSAIALGLRTVDRFVGPVWPVPGSPYGRAHSNGSQNATVSKTVDRQGPGTIASRRSATSLAATQAMRLRVQPACTCTGRARTAQLRSFHGIISRAISANLAKVEAQLRCAPTARSRPFTAIPRLIPSNRNHIPTQRRKPFCGIHPLLATLPHPAEPALTHLEVERFP